MLGRGIGISDEKLQHLGDDPLPDGVYSEANLSSCTGAFGACGSGWYGLAAGTGVPSEGCPPCQPL